MTSLIHKYHSYLATEGFFPSLDDDQDISFRYQGASFCLRIYQDDPQFFYLAMPHIHAGSADPSERVLLTAINESNLRMKAVKLTADADSDVHATVETILPAGEDGADLETFRTVLMRALNALHAARRHFEGALEAAK